MNSFPLTIKLATALSHKAEVVARQKTWQFLINRFETPRIGLKEGSVFIPADIPTGPRRQEYVKAITILTYDIDNKDVPEPLHPSELSDVINCKGLSSIMYETHSSRPGHPRFRLLVQLAEPIPREVYKSQATDFAKLLGFYDYIDKSCIDLARCYFEPAVSREYEGTHQYFVTYGEPLRISDLLAGRQGKDLLAVLDERFLTRLGLLSKSEPSVVSDVTGEQSSLAETPENIALVRSMLEAIPADIKYPGWRDVIWSVCHLGWDSGYQLLYGWSKSSTTHCDGERLADKAEEQLKKLIEEYDAGRGITFGTAYYYARQFGHTGPSPFKSVCNSDGAIVDANPAYCSGPLERLKSFSITGKSADLRQQMLDDKFVMDQVAILGQWTCLYAAPNTGKTLLTLSMLREQIQDGVIEGDQVFYVNADDTFSGMVEKLEMAESIGLQMLVPNQNNFVVTTILDLMRDMATAGEATDKIIVLDTLKKFTDLMDKRVSSNFGNTAREFVAAGGTLITLAHTNKNKDGEGKSIYGGTSDIKDDSDCVFIIDRIGIQKGFISQVHTVEFSNHKARGDVAATIGFSFEKQPGAGYIALLDSVKRLSDGDIERSKVEKEVQAGLDEDADLIAAVSDCLTAGINTKSAIVNRVHESTGYSVGKVRKFMAKRTGTFYELGHRWTVIKGANNAQFYQVLPPPSV